MLPEQLALHRLALDIAAALSSDGEAEVRLAEEAVSSALGEALFFAYLLERTGESKHRSVLFDRVDRCIQAVGHIPMSAGLHGGLAGMGWLLAHLQRMDMVSPIALDDIDEFLIALVRDPKSDLRFDAISGLVGFGVYFLERLPTAAGKEGLRLTLARLGDSCEHTSAGASWLTPSWQMPESRRAVAPEGCYDLGIAHGTAGVVALLALSLAHVPEIRGARLLLLDAARWLVAQRGTRDSADAFGNAIVPRQGPPQAESRAAWCYGNPGIGVALVLAARAADDEVLLAHALNVAANAVGRSAASSGVKDASLCHGSAGLAHIFMVLSSLTGKSEFAEKASVWYGDVLTRRSPETRGIAGYEYWDIVDGQATRTPRRDFLQGASGIGLSALSGATPGRSRAWDRLLLLS